MALDATKVRVAVTGAVYVAPTGTALPTNAGTALSADYKDVGYVHEDGVTETQDTDSEDIMAWQNGAKVRKVQTSHDLTYQFTMIETNEISLKEFYGNFTPQVGGASPSDAKVEIKGDELPRRVWVLSVLDGDHSWRIVIPDGQITERGDITYANDEAIGREVTVTCYPVNGVKATIYMDDAAVV